MNAREEFYPFKSFSIAQDYYVFSSGSNYLIKLNKEYYDILKQIEENNFILENCSNEQFLKDCKSNNLINDRTTNAYVLNNEIRHLVLMIAQDCNLNCLYCYGKAGEYNNRGKMTFDTAKQAVDYLVKHRGEQKRVYVVFFGGEPLMNLSLIQDLVSYMDEIEKTGNVSFGKSMTTNGTLLTDEIIDYCDRNRISIKISIDGPEEINDKNRVFKSGMGSYKIIMEKTENLRNKGMVSARATITPGCVDQDKIEEQLRNEGFASVGSAMAHELFSNEDYLRAYKCLSSGMDKVREMLNEKQCDIDRLNQIGFVGYLRGIHESKEADFGCGAGRKMIAVDINGDVYPCQRFVGVESCKLGNIYELELDQKKFLDKTYIDSDERQKCRKCWIRKLCLGTCAHSSYVNTGKVTENSEILCTFYRALYEDATKFYVALTDEEKKLLFG